MKICEMQRLSVEKIQEHIAAGDTTITSYGRPVFMICRFVAMDYIPIPSVKEIAIAAEIIGKDIPNAEERVTTFRERLRGREGGM